jgi:hypothetical protein
LFDAETYFNLVEKTLATCADVTLVGNRLRIFPENGGWDLWRAIMWDVSIKWPTGEELAVQDFYQSRKKEIFRQYSFHFMNQSKECIFRFDTHGESIPLGKPCHMHLGASEEIYEHGDPRLTGFRLVEIDFLQAHGLVYRYLNGKKMPWNT